MKSKQSQFADLVSRVQNCSLCPRMNQRKRVLGPSNGNLDSPVVFIAEAPGRLGADKYGIPLYGDQTGRNFDNFITSAGITRESIFITNALLCNPRELDGNNGSPTSTEIHNCSMFLNETLDIIRPQFVVTLGTTALKSLNIIEPHEIRLSDGIGRLFQWSHYRIIPLFHPGPRAFIWRSRSQQVIDYEAIKILIDKSSQDAIESDQMSFNIEMSL